jgi:histidinol-phosphatase (PHP family)
MGRIYDSHLHTEFSADSKMKAAEALQAAAAADLGLVFTEHLDLDYPGELAFSFSPESYWQKYKPLREQGKVRLGVEIGLQPGLAERNAAFLARAPFDEVIGSIHLVGGQDIYEPATYAGQAQDDIYRAYYREMAACVREQPCIDVLGHIDYIARYAPYDDPEVQYARYQTEIDAVLQAAVATATVLELNTRRLDSRLALKELAPVYHRYRELGGRAVTLGSDAHEAGAIGANFAAAEEFAAAEGLQIVSFCERQMV